MNKILKQFIIFVIVLVLLGLTNVTMAKVATISLTPNQTEYKESDTVTIEVVLSDISSASMEITGTLKYEKSELKLKSITPSGSILTNLDKGRFTGPVDGATIGGNYTVAVLEFEIVEGFVGNAVVTLESDIASFTEEEFPTATTTIKVVEKKDDDNTGSGDDNQGGNQGGNQGDDNQGGNQGGNQGDDNQGGNQGDNPGDDNDSNSNNNTVDGVIAIPEGTENTIKGTKLDEASDIYKEMKAKLLASGYNNIFCAYDLEVTGSTENGIKLAFNVGTEHNGKQAMVLHKKTNGEYETFEATVRNGKVEITVKEFSPFMLALKDNTNNSGSSTSNGQKDNTMNGKLPQTGGNNILWVGTTICVAIMATSAIFYLRTKKRGKYVIEKEI